MLKNLIVKAANKLQKGKKFIATASMAVSAFALSAIPAFASTTSDLDTVTGELVDGANSMKTNAMTIIGVVIAIFVVVFGIGWLMSIFKKKMSKAG